MTELRLDEIRGPEMIGMIRDELPNIRFLIFTGSTSPACLVAASATQPDGFVHKTESLDTLSQALTTIAGGGRFQSPTITAHLKRANEKKPDHHLTDRENTIIALVAEGRSTKEIASVINRSLKTTEELRGKLLKRLDLPHPSDVVKFALRTGLCDE
jgi:DNA-binding NarL/FixJ family response regulator